MTNLAEIGGSKMANIDYEKEMVCTVEVPEGDRLDEAALTAWFE